MLRSERLKKSLPLNKANSASALRYQKQWIQLGIAGLVALAVIALWPYKLDAAPLGTDKLLHISAYVVIASWFFQIFHENRRRLFIFLLLICYGIAIESAQHFAPMRSASVGDLAANTIGLLIGWALCQTPFQFTLQRFERHLLKG